MGRYLTRDSVKIWDINTGTILHTLDPDGDCISVAVDDDKLVTATSTRLRGWGIEAGKSIGCARMANPTASIFFNVTTIQNKMVAGYAMETNVFDITTADLLHSFEDEKFKRTTALTAASDCKVIIGLRDGRVKVLDIKNYAVLHSLSAHTDEITSIATDNDKIVTGSKDGTVKVWNIHTFKLLHTFKANTGYINSVAIGGNNVVTGSSDGIVAIWSFDAGAK